MLIGSIVVAVGVVAWVLAGWIFWRLARMRRKARTAFVGLPQRPLMVAPPNGPGEPSGLHINGLVVGEPSLTAAVSGRPCSIWELALVEIIPADYDSGEGVKHHWVTSRCADLTIECDARVVVRPRPRRGQPYDVTPGRLTVRVAGAQVQVPHPGGTDPGLSLFRGSRRPVDLAALERAGAPGHLVAQVRARPDSYYLLEGSIAPGELVALFQQTSVPGEVDPYAPALLGVTGYDGDLAAQGLSMVGCLTVVLTVAGVAAAAVGAFALTVGLPRLLS